MKEISQEEAPTGTGMNEEHDNSGEADDYGQVNDVEPTSNPLTEAVLKQRHTSLLWQSSELLVVHRSMVQGNEGTLEASGPWKLEGDTARLPSKLAY